MDFLKINKINYKELLYIIYKINSIYTLKKYINDDKYINTITINRIIILFLYEYIEDIIKYKIIFIDIIKNILKKYHDTDIENTEYIKKKTDEIIQIKNDNVNYINTYLVDIVLFYKNKII